MSMFLFPKNGARDKTPLFAGESSKHANTSPLATPAFKASVDSSRTRPSAPRFPFSLFVIQIVKKIHTCPPFSVPFPFRLKQNFSHYSTNCENENEK